MKRISLWVLCLSLAACIPGAAQTITGAITGTVTDPAGASVPGATVTATDLATNVKTATKTNQAGDYSIRFLQIGQYTVTVEAAGFKTANYPPFSLEIDQTVKINAALIVGATATRVMVSGQLQPLLNTQSATLGTTFTEHVIQNVPLNGRDFGTLTMLMPGSIAVNFGEIGGQSSNEREINGESASQAQVNGNRPQSNNYLLDGQEINEPAGNLIAYTPSPDALAQVRVISSNANAEFGNVVGGEVLMVTKSGTNQFRGSAFGIFQNQDLAANSWANNHNVIPVPKSAFKQDYFGGTIGGPIIKNKLFFFADYQRFHVSSSGGGTYSVATASMRTGDLSNLYALGAGNQLYNTQDVVGGAPVEYVNNQIPVTSPVAQYLFNNLNAYPLPNNPSADPSGVYNNYIGTQSSESYNQQGDVKIDWHPTGNDSVMGRYTQGYAGDDSPKIVIPVAFSGVNDYPDHFLSLNWVHTFSAALVNSARASYGRIGADKGFSTDPSGIFGLNGNDLVGVTGPPQTQPGFSLMDVGSEGGPGSYGIPADVGINPRPTVLRDNVFEYADNLNWQRGRHLIKFGAEFNRYQENYYTATTNGALGQFTYSGGFTSNPLSAVSEGGNLFADFMVDEAQQVAIGNTKGGVGMRQWRDAIFAQDDFKVTPNLTLNLGVRYEYDQPLYEVNNKEVNIINGALAFAGVNGNSRALYNPTYDEVMPRVGFAWQPRPRVVLRGGYGSTSFLEGTGFSLRLSQNYPFSTGYVKIGSNPSVDPNGVYTPGNFYTVTEGFPTTPPAAQTEYRVWSQNLKPAVNQEVSLTTEYQLSQTTAVQLGYVGVMGRHLIVPLWANQWTSPTATAPYANFVGQSGAIIETESEGNSNYQALQAVYRQHLTAGLALTVNYTWGKSLTDSAGFEGADNNTSNLFPMDAYHPHLDYGPSISDVRNSLSVIAVYDLPFGRGKKFGSNWNPVENSLLGGWILSGISVDYSGFPLTLSSPSNYSSLVNAIGEARPVQNRPLRVVNRSLNAYYGTQVQGTSCGPNVNNGICVFSQEPTTGFSTLGVGTLRAPGFNQIDMAVQKNFALWHSNVLLFRADFFNAFNMVSYSPPDNFITDSTFGQITSTRSSPRQGQLELKYSF